MPDQPATPSPYTDSVRAYYAAHPSPLVAATGIVLDSRGRVLVLTTSYKTELDLPGGGVEDTETPEEGLARELKEELDLSVPVGRLLAVDSRPPGPLGRSLVVHVHLVGPLTPEEASAISFPDGEITEARWLTPEEAYEALPARNAPRLSAALAALYAGSLAHLIGGVPQPGSPAGFDPARRAELEHAGAYDPADHRAARPKALTAASVIFTDSAAGVLLVRPAYGDTDHWNLPGGGIDSDLGEIPRAAARREVLEELGLDLAPGRLLGVNWSHRPGYPARVRFLYDGGTLGSADLARIRLPGTELLQWRAVAPAELRRFVKPALRRQIEACLGARATGAGPLELHAGRPLDQTHGPTGTDPAGEPR
ncbi:NUDIX domain-containing protein [Streptomyces sp. H34-S4]|uniref:NUDIX domain-containing protein n=1 Tax=Streptomyces sp. H34-S4 TaxID=2996463 RepID=UPI00226FCE7D|nr:NUDIX hydrolase [Streptomyces sp. H34-S4]MCY0938049.1 NUDIX hydrolase [Streptomyces sp. H34-S4]